ncbi:MULTISPECIES: CopG family transcriptional regulator [Caulobacter]|uniref:CopG family transcriptional regulator n=1 Tax=Caulobacter TaxID=75 RepID=UPI000BB4CE01|nr:MULTISPECIES: CopG family transcriptional regulator [Caulobacter]ATC24346.1 CopG family transcriptional regulator [Caulobacter vibrioides]MBQ1562457.1 CopG family transcriptional regulator [Caulobacter sp.]
MKVQTKVFLSRDLSLSLDAAARRMRRSKSEIMQAALASFLSADGDEAQEAAVVRRLDRMGRELERIQRDVTISNEAVALFVRAWLTATPVLAEADQRAQSAKGQERYVGFLEALGRRLEAGKLLRTEIPEERAVV